MKLKLSILATLLVASASTFAAPVQWTVGSGGNDHWYDYVSTSVSWATARTNALASNYLGLGGYLATVTSAAENGFIATNFRLLAWLGGTDDAVEGAWKWSDGPEAGAAFTYTNWEPGEPNNCCGGEDYLQLNWAFNGGWNDHGGPGNAGQTNGYIVEYSGNPAPEPASLALFGAALALMRLTRRRA
jgi:hypothetical protein